MQFLPTDSPGSTWSILWPQILCFMQGGNKRVSCIFDIHRELAYILCVCEREKACTCWKVGCERQDFPHLLHLCTSLSSFMLHFPLFYSLCWEPLLTVCLSLCWLYLLTLPFPPPLVSISSQTAQCLFTLEFIKFQIFLLKNCLLSFQCFQPYKNVYK